MKALKQPATIIAMLALFVALGGTAAVAGGLINGSKIKNHSIPASKLTKSAIAALHGQQGPKGDKGDTGDTGAKGDAGANGSARAWARINANGTLVPGESLHVSSVAHLSTGDYCVELDSNYVNHAIAVAIASPYYPLDDTHVGVGGIVTTAEAKSYCGTNGMEVVTLTNTNGTVALADEPFTIAVP